MRLWLLVRVFALAIITSSASLTSAQAQGVSTAELIAAGMPASLAEFAARVSASEGDWDSLNQYGCAGAFQFCPATRRRYTTFTVEDFLASPREQVNAYRRYMADEWRLAQRMGYTSLIGRNLCWEGACATITASSIIMACQFGCGNGGKLWTYWSTGNCDSPRARDGNGLSVCTYLIRGSGYDVSAITGETEPGALTAGITTCLMRDPFSMAGAAVSSPFGVDRTGRASAGYHLGLDLVNGAGRGDSVFASVDGVVVRSHADSTNSVFIETSDGRQRIGFLHGQARRVAVGDAVLVDTVVITMGDTGSPGAVHLHLEVHVSGEVMASLGEAAGRVWPLQSRESFFGSKGSSGLLGSTLEGAAPAAFYVVNPETYLHTRIPFRPAILTAYASQGLSRPDGLTLEPTCSPSADMLLSGGMASSNGGFAPGGGWSDFGVAAMANLQTLANMAASDGRDAAIQYGQAAIGDARLGAGNRDNAEAQSMMLAGLILAPWPEEK
ncbi:MAG: M23 family metallopeptidase [Burkholderiaceae bacterium]|jgi:murein DD-endopeptidase MepM/ murein hydrolase activator NlpD|nr:M23 family metallopeptidase [Burkholderiaceae bacterium]